MGRREIIARNGWGYERDGARPKVMAASCGVCRTPLVRRVVCRGLGPHRPYTRSSGVSRYSHWVRPHDTRQPRRSRKKDAA